MDFNRKTNNLELIKSLLNIDSLDTSKDNILEHYLNKAYRTILSYCNVDVLSDVYDSIIVDYAIYLYKNKDNAGVISKRQGERSVTLETGIPEQIKQSLPLPKIRVLGWYYMFYEFQATILDAGLNKIKPILCDFQNFDKTLKFEDDIEIDITNRAFANVDSSINLNNYITVNDITYKIMRVKKYDDYMEAWLYELDNI